VVDDCANMSLDSQQRYGEVEVIVRGVEAAVTNLDRHVKMLDQKNADVQAWAADIRKDDDLTGADWDATISLFRSIPASYEMIKFITGRDIGKGKHKPTLEDLVDAEEVKKAGKDVQKISSTLHQGSSSLGAQVDEVLRRTDELLDRIEKSPALSVIGRGSEVEQLMEDIEAIARRISNDYENVLGFSNSAKNVSQASKSALLHTKNFLPNLSKRSLEMDGILRSVTQKRNTVAADSLEAMRDIALVTALVSEANAKFTALQLNGDAFEAINLLSVVNELPVTYASFMAEAIRRREWNDKVRSDSSTLANEMASFQDEEAKRRRKWQKSTGTTLWGDKAERKVISLEVNLLGDEDDWPDVTRQDLENMLELLRAQGSKSSHVADISKMIDDLNNPTKQQSKRAKAFKAGSIHENALGRSALLMRGDDDLIRVLQEEKHKTEGKLKTAESRVRRLEDLLHRQTQVTRTSTGNVFQPSGFPSPDAQMLANNPLASPRLHEDISRRSSVSSRRFSANQSADEKAFQQKLLSLEAELIAEKERAAELEREIFARKTTADTMKTEVDEAISTKKDLMENFEAQQREFLEERRSLEETIKEHKSRLEELEDELERYLGSRENERTTTDERVRDLMTELERVRKEAALEAQKAQGQVDFLRNDAKMQREANEAIEKQLQQARDQNRELLARTQKAEHTAHLQMKVLQDVYAQVATTFIVPEDLGELADALVTLSGDLVAELSSIKSDSAIARSDRDAAQLTITELKLEMEALQEKLAAEQLEKSQLYETLAGERARFAALGSELADERSQLSTLRTKIADGETGSEALRLRLEEEEEKVTNMSEDLAARQSRIGGLEEELRSVQEKYQSAHIKHDKLNSRFEARTSRAKDLTQRVYAQNDRLCRLLERLSYSVTREGKSMVIQRLPKPERSNTANDSSDPGSSLRKSISGAMTRKAMVDSGDLDLLYWMHNDDSEVETDKYEAYLNAIGNFDVEQFCEVITKRVKDMEYTAKKYNKDARAYREKSHSAQKEAHEKIAFKNFKEGDLALFLPTRNQATGAWAAFNVGAPHYFLREQESHKLRTRDWLLARIHKIEDRVVDLSKSMSSTHLNVSDGRSFGETSNGGDSFEDDNPFDLSDGLRWYLIDAAEEKPGAPSTPGLGKSTVASTNDYATGSIRRSKKSSSSGVDGINKTLSKSLDSRRSSNNSKKSVSAANTLIKTGSTATDTASLKAVATTQTSGEASEPQNIASSSRQEGSGSGDKVLSTEVRNNHIDDLLGP
jgi:autophagy-related protein 11